MSFQPINSKQAFLPTSIILPELEDSQKHNYILTDYLKKIIASVNNKEIAQYVQTETLTGQKFFTPNDSQKFRETFRKTVDFGALPNATSKSIPHGITVNATTVFTKIMAAATNPTGFAYIPLPYASPAGADNIELSLDATSITITTASDRTAFTTCYVILEYIKS